MSISPSSSSGTKSKVINVFVKLLFEVGFLALQNINYLIILLVHLEIYLIFHVYNY